MGLTFSETMRGPFDLSARTPDDGARRGQENKTELVLNVTIEIADIDQFLQDPDHKGELKGEITHPGLKGSMESQAGSFQLFRPGSEPHQKEMVYELALNIEGESYRFVGKKLRL